LIISDTYIYRYNIFSYTTRSPFSFFSSFFFLTDNNVPDHTLINIIVYDSAFLFRAPYTPTIICLPRNYCIRVAYHAIHVRTHARVHGDHELVARHAYGRCIRHHHICGCRVDHSIIIRCSWSGPRATTTPTTWPGSTGRRHRRLRRSRRWWRCWWARRKRPPCSWTPRRDR
jgi:hypothetical protein